MEVADGGIFEIQASSKAWCRWREFGEIAQLLESGKALCCAVAQKGPLGSASVCAVGDSAPSDESEEFLKDDFVTSPVVVKAAGCRTFE